jgi:hypothetical protein
VIEALEIGRSEAATNAMQTYSQVSSRNAEKIETLIDALGGANKLGDL